MKIKYYNFKKITFLIVSTILMSMGLVAQEVYYHEDFDGDLGEWTSEGFEVSVAGGPSIDWENDIFVWDADGLIRGGLGVALDDNGCALIDAVTYQIEAYQRDSMDFAPPYGKFDVHLISPEIDISGSEKINLQFTHGYRLLNRATNGVPLISYALSVDGEPFGNWIAVPRLTAPVGNVGQSEKEVFDFYLPALDNASKMQVKFRFHADFYYWAIADVKITEGDASELYAEPSFLYGRPSFSSQPLTNIKTDVIPLTVAARQYGYENASVTATVEITHSATSEVIHTETLEDVQLPSTKGDAGDTLQYIRFQDWTPTIEVAGDYVVKYILEEKTLDDITETSFMFNVSEESFASFLELDNGRGIGSNSYIDIDALDFGNLFYIPENASGNFFLEKIELAYEKSPSDGSVENDNFIVLFQSVSSDVDCPSMEQFNTTDQPGPTANEQLSTIGLAEVPLAEYTARELFEVEITDGQAPLPKELRKINPGTCYMVWVQIIGLEAGAIMMDRNPFGHVALGTGVFNSMVYIPKDEDYYGYGFNAGAAIKVSFDTEVSSNEPELADAVLNAYPNPTSDYLKADLSFENPVNVTVTTFDMTGKVMSLRVIDNVTNQTVTTNVKDYPAGTYYFRIQTPQGQKTITFIKQ